MVQQPAVVLYFGDRTVRGLCFRGTSLGPNRIISSRPRNVPSFQIMCYEALKIFSDRLGRLEQKHTLLNILNDSVKADWDLANIADQAARHYYVPKGEALNKARVFEKLSKEVWEIEVRRGIAQFGRQHLVGIIVNG